MPQPRRYDLTTGLRDDTVLLISEASRQHLRISIEGGPKSCPVSLPHRNDISTLFLNFDLEDVGYRPGEVQVLHLQGNATVLRLERSSSTGVMAGRRWEA